MPKRRSRIRKKSVKKSLKRSDNRGKIRNPKTGRYVKKSGVIGKKLLAKSRKKKSTKKRRSRRVGRSRGQNPSNYPEWLTNESISPSIEELVQYCNGKVDGLGEGDALCSSAAEEAFYDNGHREDWRPPIELFGNTEADFKSWWKSKKPVLQEAFINNIRNRYENFKG